MGPRELASLPGWLSRSPQQGEMLSSHSWEGVRGGGGHGIGNHILGMWKGLRAGIVAGGGGHHPEALPIQLSLGSGAATPCEELLWAGRGDGCPPSPQPFLLEGPCTCYSQNSAWYLVWGLWGLGLARAWKARAMGSAEVK